MASSTCFAAVRSVFTTERTAWPIRVLGHPEGALSYQLLIRTGLSHD
jgi:hypothetical protein